MGLTKYVRYVHQSIGLVALLLSSCFISSQINCRGKFLCFFFNTLLRVTRTLWKYFPVVTSPLPTGELGKLPPPSPWKNPIPSLGGGDGYFLEPHNVGETGECHIMMQQPMQIQYTNR